MTSNRHSRIDALIILPPRPGAVLRRICEDATSTLKREGVEPTVGADKKPIVGSQQRLEGYVHPFAGAIDCRCGEDLAARHGLGNEAAADAAEPVPIELIGTGILAERKQQRLTPASPGHIERQ